MTLIASVLVGVPDIGEWLAAIQTARWVRVSSGHKFFAGSGLGVENADTPWLITTCREMASSIAEISVVPEACPKGAARHGR